MRLMLWVMLPPRCNQRRVQATKDAKAGSISNARASDAGANCKLPLTLPVVLLMIGREVVALIGLLRLMHSQESSSIAIGGIFSSADMFKPIKDAWNRRN